MVQPLVEVRMLELYKRARSEDAAHAAERDKLVAA